VENPFGFGQLLTAIYLYVKKPIEITLRKTKGAGEGYQMMRWLNRQFIPNAIIVILENHLLSSKLQEYPFFEVSDSSITNETEYAVVCRDFTCSLPIFTLADLQKQVKPAL
jgi:uncharacterized protein YyaL (SSP411 family)